MSVNAADTVARRIVDVTADCGISLVASLPDDWITSLITHYSRDAPGRAASVRRAAASQMSHRGVSNDRCRAVGASTVAKHRLRLRFEQGAIRSHYISDHHRFRLLQPQKLARAVRSGEDQGQSKKGFPDHRR